MNIVPVGRSPENAGSAASWALSEAICSAVNAPPQQGQAMSRAAELEVDVQAKPLELAPDDSVHIPLLSRLRRLAPHVVPRNFACCARVREIAAPSKRLRGGGVCARGQGQRRRLLL
jgi:hypothetical protein